VKRNKKVAAVESAVDRTIGSYWPQAEQFAEDLKDRVDPYRKQFVDAVGPYAEQAYKSGAHAAHAALERVTPALDDAWDRVNPAVETARAKVQGEFLPKLNAILADAAGHPVAVEATKRGKATAAALRGELEVPEKKRRFPKVLGVLAVIAAAGGIAVVVKKYLDSRDAEWEAPAPSTYGGSNTPKRAETSPWATASDSAASAATPPAAGASVSETVADAAAGTSSASASSASTSSTPTSPSTPATEAAAGSDATGEGRSYGAGSYVGTKPPAGFEIKGNERSMKYHTPDSPAYERTISDVWFSSAEAAEANGFTRAQR